MVAVLPSASLPTPVLGVGGRLVLVAVVVFGPMASAPSPPRYDPSSAASVLYLSSCRSSDAGSTNTTSDGDRPILRARWHRDINLASAVITTVVFLDGPAATRNRRAE